MFDPNRSIRAEQDVNASCASKQAFPARWQAQNAVLHHRARAKRQDRDASTLKVYRCRFGAHWHIGNAL